MTEKKIIKRIHRIAKGEVVIVNALQEDLQEKYDAMKELQRDAMDADAAAREEPTEKNWEDRERKAGACEKAKIDFWIATHERYGHWGQNVGIRDGYALVTIPNYLPDFLNGFLGGGH